MASRPGAGDTTESRGAAVAAGGGALRVGAGDEVDVEIGGAEMTAGGRGSRLTEPPRSKFSSAGLPITPFDGAGAGVGVD